jgi:intracellular sulfur oxidation DsrE/DsrF family protein
VRQIKLHKHAIIDTPGYNSGHSILQDIKNLKDINKLQVNKKIKPVSFQITEDQSFIIDNLINLSIETDKLASVIFYVSNKLPILRTKTINLERNLKNYLNQKIEVIKSNRSTKSFELDSASRYNLCINGLGLILIKGATKLSVNTFKNVDLNLLEKVII